MNVIMNILIHLETVQKISLFSTKNHSYAVLPTARTFFCMGTVPMIDWWEDYDFNVMIMNIKIEPLTPARVPKMFVNSPKTLAQWVVLITLIATANFLGSPSNSVNSVWICLDSKNFSSYYPEHDECAKILRKKITCTKLYFHIIYHQTVAIPCARGDMRVKVTWINQSSHKQSWSIFLASRGISWIEK